ncbi:interleukin-1 beta-like isoform X2 [Megalops cyprinoides]|uniref:interleukin-1 beta-like isoform X2 n=1 Tax=Megalops cyprinoides TaxID=118141 RepID=UPI0018646931|nr:interleukin-1 beta-like isoform X2 [Megalops cyprinoides]XP_036382851.1 interleukin-1 beta-like isoform X2 [Megalops cyprinoides]
MEFEGNCNALKKKGTENKMDLCCDPNGELQSEVAQHPQSMRHVANLIIALQRMKNSHTAIGTEFSDHELLNILMENVVEERSMRRVNEDTESRVTTYISTSQEKYDVRDQFQKSWVLIKEARELQAMTLQGGSVHHKVQLNLSTYVAPGTNNSHGRPVALGIVGTDLYLSCSVSSDKAILQLEEVKDKDALKTISGQGDMVRFLFLKGDSGLSMNSFESARIPGWFISTAKEDKKPVEMCSAGDSNRITYFKVNNVSDQ